MSIEMPISFYVSGGGNVSGESGVNILKDLKSIVSQIESSGITKLKFGVDTQATQNALSGIQEQISKITNLNGSNKNTISFSLSNVAKESTKAMSASTAELTRARVATQNAKTEIVKLVGQKQLETAIHKKNTAAITEENAKRKQAEAAANRQSSAERKHNNELKQEINTQLQYNKILDQARHYYDKYSTNIQKKSNLNNDWQKYLKRMESNPDFSFTTEARDALASLQRQTYEAGAEVETTSQKLQRLFGAHFNTAIAMIGIHLLQKSLREIISTVKELDSALVDLQIATGYSRDKTRELIADYSELGKQLGATTAQVAAASNDWLRQGYSVEQANILIKDSMMLSKLGQLEASESTTALTSAMRGYGVSVEDTVKIVDKLVSVDMKAAVSAGDIATAMAETATGAKLAGVELDTLVGYITTVKEVTQDGAESVGIFLKTLFSRMGNVKMGRLSDPETEEDLSGVETVLSGVGIALRDASDKFRDFDVILNEVAANWDNYSNVQQRAIAVAFSGTRNQEKFLVLMEHYDEAMKYAEIATNSAGTALDKYNNTYLKGVEAAQNRAKASFEALSTTILNSDLVAGGFNAGSGILEFLNSILSVGDGAVVKIGVITGAFAVLDKLKVGRNLPTMPEKHISTVGFDKSVNCWETYARHYNYKVA